MSRPPLSKKRILKNLWKQVIIKGPDDCWIWTGAGDPYGYLRWRRPNGEGYLEGVHRIVLMEKIGHYLKSGEHACHTCDTPKCLNPKHLFVGSNYDNRMDMAYKMQNGIRSGQYDCKLTKEKVKQMRESYTGIRGEMKQLAKIHGVTLETILYALQGKSWKHAGGPIHKGKVVRI